MFHRNYSLKCSRKGVIWKIIKFSFNKSFFELRHNDIPLRYQQIRCGERQVKPDHYLLMHILKSKYHKPENMAQGAIAEVANHLFDQKEHGKWKP